MSGCVRRVLACTVVLLAAVIAFVVGVTALFVYGLGREQQQSDAWFLGQIESRLGVDFGDGEWGTFEQRVYSSGRDYHLEAVVRLREPMRDAALSDWPQTPCPDATLADFAHVTGVMDETLVLPMKRALLEAGNRYCAVVRREGDWLDRFDLCVLNESEDLLYVIALDF